MSANDAADRELRAGITAAVRCLVDAHDRPIVLHGGELSTRQVPALVAQLRDSVGAGMEARLATPRSGRPLPISERAHDELVALTADVTEIHLQALALGSSADSVEARIRHIGQLAAGWSDVEALSWILRAVSRWTSQILAVLDPPRHHHLAAPCPLCGVRMVGRQDRATGETTLQPALSVDTIDGAHCGNCGATWTAQPNELDHLARLIEHEATAAPQRQQHDAS